MTPERIFLLAVTLLALGLIMRGRWRIDVAGFFLLAALGTGQYLGLDLVEAQGRPVLRIFSGFAQPMVFTLMGLFILTRALTRQGVLDWLSGRLVRLSGGSERRLTALFSGLAILLSQVMNNVAVGALLLPGALQASRRTKVYPSQLLMPIAYATALGGMATYFTTANIVMSDLLAAARPPQAPLGIFSFLAVGALISLSGLAYLSLAGPRLLPARPPAGEARRRREDLERLYALEERLWEARISPDSPLAGRALGETPIGKTLGLSVVAIRRGHTTLCAPASEVALHPGDTLLVAGRAERAARLRGEGCTVQPARRRLGELGVTLLEIMPAPHANLHGKTLRQLAFRRLYGFTAVALMRRGRSYRTDVGALVLEQGDTLLVAGPPERTADLRRDLEWIVLEAEPPTRPRLGWRAWASIALFAGVVGFSLWGAPVYLAVTGMALLALLLRLLPPEETYRAVDWPVIIFLAGMYAVGLGMVHTGLVADAGHALMRALPHPAPLLLAGAAFGLAALLTQFIGSQATAFVIGPIFINAAIHLNTNPQAVAVAAAIGCGASFLTPVSHPVNLIMVTPGNYRFGDYPRLGAGLLLVTFAALLAGMRLFWGL